MGGGSIDSCVLCYPNGNIVVSYDPGDGFNPEAGDNTRSGAISIGDQAGQTSQNQYAVAIGNQAGRYHQNNMSVAIGHYAGEINQGLDDVGPTTSSSGDSVAIGNQAGRY